MDTADIGRVEVDKLDLMRRSVIAAEQAAIASSACVEAANESALLARRTAFWAKLAALVSIVAFVVSMATLFRL